MDYTVFYYGHSTIGQTLASAFSFIVAVALFRIQAISSSEPVVFQNALAMFKAVREDKLKGETQASELEEKILYGVKHLAETRENIKKSLRYSLYWTSGTIIACLVLMPLTNSSMIGNPYAASVLLALTVMAGIYSITTYKPLIEGMMQPGKTM